SRGPRPDRNRPTRRLSLYNGSRTRRDAWVLRMCPQLSAWNILLSLSVFAKLDAVAGHWLPGWRGVFREKNERNRQGEFGNRRTWTASNLMEDHGGISRGSTSQPTRASGHGGRRRRTAPAHRLVHGLLVSGGVDYAPGPPRAGRVRHRRPPPKRPRLVRTHAGRRVGNHPLGVLPHGCRPRFVPRPRCAWAPGAVFHLAVRRRPP